MTSKRNTQKKLNPKLKTDHMAKAHVTKEEYDKLKVEYENSGYRSFSSFLRKRLTARNSQLLSINPVEFLERLDLLGTEMNRIGNNINQVSKQTNKLAKHGKVNPDLIGQFNHNMDEYLKCKHELMNIFRSAFKKI